MIKYWPIYLILLLCWSCTEISYKEPQPKGIKEIKEIPEKLQGAFLVEENGVLSEDTIFILQNGYRIGFKGAQEKPEVRYISDTLVVKQYKGYYFFNYREDVAWYLRVVQVQPNQDLSLLAMSNIDGLREEEKQDFLTRLSKEVPLVYNTLNENTYYVIDPSPKQLVKLIKKGYFKPTLMRRLK